MSATQTNGKANGTGTGSVLQDAVRVHDAALKPTHRMPREKFAKWLRDKSSAEQGEYRCTVFLLNHDHETNGLRPVTPARIPKGAKAKTLEEAIERIVDEFDDASFEHAKRFPRTQGYIVGGMVKDSGAALAETQFPFNVTPPADIAEEMHQRGAEVNSAALVGHITRTLEKKEQLYHERSQAELDRLTALMQAHIIRLDHLEDRGFSRAIALEESLNAKALREVQVKREEMWFDLQKEGALKVIGIASKVADKYLERKDGAAAGIVPAPASGPEAYKIAVQAVVPAEVVALVNGMSEEQKALAGPVIEFAMGMMPKDKQLEINMLAALSRKQPDETPPPMTEEPSK